MYIWLILALIFAALEILAISKNIRRLGYLAKPAVMVCLFLWLVSTTGLQGDPFWFGMGILFSLLGDVLLMISRDRMFLFGLLAFLLAHIFYVLGFRETLAAINLWSVILAIFIALNVARLLRRIAGAMRLRGEGGWVMPVMVYGTVISLMLYAAMLTIYDPAWKTGAAFLVSAGAFLFCASDLMLAWDKFVSPIQNGRAWSITLYYLGQIGLTAGVVSQFGLS
ncbi:MAG TPA: lysoplasmalogenase [Anaerolineales bacterium]|nr:lysoplasmalogenase [Anaerolineales bacterium]